jgi:hypothetical protein
MDREEICRRVIEIADRFGPDRPQEVKLLSSQLSRCQPVEVLAGLMLVFSRSEPRAANYRKQELAGRMLEKLNPKAPVDLPSTLRQVLPAYNVSIEQVPQYLAGRCGRDSVLQELRLFEAEDNDARSKAAAKTMRWWLSDQTVR